MPDLSKIIGTDISFYESPVDFNKMKFGGASFTIIKVGQDNFIDRDFHLLNYNARGILPRGFYWFYDKGATPQSQAKLWFDAMGGDYGELPLFADFEGEYGKGQIDNFKIFLEEVKRLIPNKEIVIYTAYYFWKDDSGYNFNYAEYFKQYALWIATYGATPQIPAPWTDWLFWQFDDKGSGTIYGTKGGSVDLNYFNGDMNKFIQRFNITEVPTNSPSNIPNLIDSKSFYDGMIYEKFTKNLPNSGLTTYHVLKFDPIKTEFFVSPYIGNNHVPALLKKFGMDFAINGDGWVTDPIKKITSITGYASSRGQPYQHQLNQEPTIIYVDEGTKFTLTKPNKLWNAFSVANVLVKNGSIPVINKADDWRARTTIGWGQGKIIVVIVDGQDYYSKFGASFKETAQICLDAGCEQAFMLDGGGSSTLAMAGSPLPVVLNKPYGEEKVISYPDKMRFVAQILGFKMKTPAIEIPPIVPNGDNVTSYKVIKSARFRSLPTTTTNDTGASSVVGEVFDSNITQLDTKNSNINMVQHPNGKWLPLYIGSIIYTHPQTDNNFPPPVGGIVKTNTIEVFSDGSVKITPV